MSFNFSPKIVTNGLTVYHDVANVKCYSGSGTSILDLIDYTNGILTSGTSVSNGVLVFDGINDYVNLGSGSTVDVVNNFTFEIWFNTNTISTATTIFSKAETGSYNCDLNLFASGLNFSGFIAGQYRTVTNPLVNYTINQWYHMSATYDNVNMRLYSNGVLVNSLPITGNITNTTVPLFLGANPQTDGNHVQFFNGSLALFKIYNRVLSASEIAQNYNAMRKRFGV